MSTRQMILMAALTTVATAPGVYVAPGNVFEVETEDEAARLVEIGAAERLKELEDVLDERYAEIQRVGAFAIGTVLLTGQAGADLPAGAVLLVEDGPSYRTTDAVTLGATGLAAVPVRADEPGEVGNLPAGTEMLLDASFEGVDEAAKVGEHGLTGGVDAADAEA